VIVGVCNDCAKDVGIRHPEEQRELAAAGCAENSDAPRMVPSSVDFRK
jgi:hypothetical protein